MVAQINYLCDNCSRPKAEHIGPLDLGDGKRMIDLCARCVKEHALITLGELLAEYGVEPPATVAARTTKGRPAPHGETRFTCPVCSRDLSSRSYTLAHLSTVHGMTPQAASRAVRPVGKARVCEVCDVLLDERGYGAHMERSHPGTPAPTNAEVA